MLDWMLNEMRDLLTGLKVLTLFFLVVSVGMIIYKIIELNSVGLENRYVCHIEYIDGTKESINCWYASTPDEFLNIEIYKCGNSQKKSLATIKRWTLQKKDDM